MDEDLVRQFDELGIEPPPDVIAKSMEICITHRIDNATEFVEQWIAYSISHLNGAEPTVNHLNEFERKVFVAKRDKELVTANKKKSKYSSVAEKPLHANASDINPLTIYGIESGNDHNCAENNDNETINDYENIADDDVLSSYNVCKTPKAKSIVAARTPARHNEALFSPASYSPILGTPRSHQMAASGKIVYTFGNASIISNGKWASMNQTAEIHVRQCLLHNDEPLCPATARYMFDSLRDKSDIKCERLFRIGKQVCHDVFGDDIDDYALSQVDMRSQKMIKIIGVIGCDHDGPLDPSSAIIIDSDEACCRMARLNFSRIKSVGIFPGQIVMVAGMNPSGDVFMVHDVITNRLLKAPPAPLITQQLSLVIAAGPYTHDDDLVYDPLTDLIAYCKQNMPDVLILMGPFLEADHKMIAECVTLAESLESFFEKIIAGLLEALGSTITILIVSSHRDANVDPVFPTLPLAFKTSHPNVHTLPDPSLVDLNGITIGMTTTGIVDHLISHELSVNAGDKIKRALNYLFEQRTFYPLSPPAEEKIGVDSALLNQYGNIDQMPNLLIVPSDQKCFIRVVNGCLAINPGYVTNNSGGTFARIIITPPDQKDESNLSNYIACQVLKV